MLQLLKSLLIRIHSPDNGHSRKTPVSFSIFAQQCFLLRSSGTSHRFVSQSVSCSGSQGSWSKLRIYRTVPFYIPLENCTIHNPLQHTLVQSQLPSFPIRLFDAFFKIGVEIIDNLDPFGISFFNMIKISLHFSCKLNVNDLREKLHDQVKNDLT